MGLFDIEFWKKPEEIRISKTEKWGANIPPQNINLVFDGYDEAVRDAVEAIFDTSKTSAMERYSPLEVAQATNKTVQEIEEYLQGKVIKTTGLHNGEWQQVYCMAKKK